jgi:hypothetical protein
MTSKIDDNNPGQPIDQSEPEPTQETHDSLKIDNNPPGQPTDQSESEPAQETPDLFAPDSFAQDTMSEGLKCPVCGFPYRVGELTCSNCHYIFVAGGKTQHIEAGPDLIAPKDWPTGEVILPDRKPIIFEIEGKEFVLPGKDELTVGRNTGNPTDAAPDVDLTPYGAADSGVSRLHVRIRRKGVLLYVVDLGSTNGTWLNGRKLIPDGERLLRHGDQLRLSRLKIRVRF